jgi:hypothetical protein
MQIQVKQNDLTYGSFTLTPTGMTTVGMPSFEEWLKCGDFIQRTNRSVHFWIGDWLNFGEGAYGETYTQAMDDTKFAYQTLKDDKWVASRIEKSRRRDNLSFSHHKEIADLEPEEQEQMLDMAEKNHLKSAEFRKAVRHYKLKLDVPELTEEQLKPTDPIVLEKAQEIIDASVHTLELLDSFPWESVDEAAKDWLVSHLKKAATHYFKLVGKYDKQKPISESVVQNA